ncbi:hypothetical protein N657DRAFT_678318 [Parathielavia appendiculata]|uniref:Uncharacterized protein n=1 Tax=Parathielavia appendiculata TaxID=2587402 RepID=A0AAN6U7N0_9PEZI|nr:hypothetical protein N657DRAFT_678318 [Parathielavia appendiculata]
MAPSDVKKTVEQTARTSSGPAKRHKPRSKRAGSNNAGAWSDWYFSEEQNCFWRARQTQNGTWDYEFAPGHQDQETTPTTSSSQLGQPLSPVPESPPASPSLKASINPSSPKSSWRSVITTSTGFQTEGLFAWSSRTLTALPEEVDYLIQPYPASTVTFGRNTFLAAQATECTGTCWEHIDHGQLVSIKNRTTSALAKKLHAKVKSEKKLKANPKRRVKTWLKGVEVDLAPIPLDIQGLPIYR